MALVAPRAAGSGSGEQALADMRAWGASPADIARAAAAIERRREAETIEIMPCNAEAVRLFDASLTQWRYAGTAGLATGLDYAGVAAAAAMRGTAMTADLFERLRVMEAAALDALAAAHG